MIAYKFVFVNQLIDWEISGFAIFILLAELLPHARLIEIPDSYTLIPEDQPVELARAIRQFIRDTPGKHR